MKKPIIQASEVVAGCSSLIFVGLWLFDLVPAGLAVLNAWAIGMFMGRWDGRACERYDI